MWISNDKPLKLYVLRLQGQYSMLLPLLQYLHSGHPIACISEGLLGVTYNSFSTWFPGISQPYKIDIFEDYIYGTGLKHEVFKIHKYGKQPVEFLSLGLEKPTNVLISHRYKQQDGKWLKKKISLSIYAVGMEFI